MSNLTLQNEYDKLVVYWSHLSHSLLGKSMDEFRKLGAIVAEDLKFLKDNLSEGMPYLLK